MNNRIRELAWENGCRARKFTKGVSIYPNVDEDLERFALAIIRECAAMADFADSNPGEYVLKHFGVEE